MSAGVIVSESGFFCVCAFVMHVTPPKTECSCLHGRVIENGRARNPLTLCSVPELVHVQACVHIPGDPQSVKLRNVALLLLCM